MLNLKRKQAELNADYEKMRSIRNKSKQDSIVSEKERALFHYTNSNTGFDRNQKAYRDQLNIKLRR